MSTKVQIPLDEKPWLTQAEAAAYLCVSDRTLRNYVARGDLEGYKLRGSRLMRYKRADLDALACLVPTVARQRAAEAKAAADALASMGGGAA